VDPENKSFRYHPEVKSNLSAYLACSYSESVSIWLLQVEEHPRKKGNSPTKRAIRKGKIMEIHRLLPFFGYPRMSVALRKAVYCVNHKRVYRLMKELDIRSVIRKKRRYFGKTASVIHPNRLNRQFQTEYPDRFYVTDITYLPVNNRFYYLSAVQDLFNNQIVAWKVSARNDLKLVMDTVEVLQTKRDLQGALLHSDQGFQYTSRQYNQRLAKTGCHRQPLSQRKLLGQCVHRIFLLSFEDRNVVLFPV
jgi:hypothetical protein